MSVDHPVLSIGADLQLESGDMVSLLSFLRNGALGGDACKHLQSMEVHLLVDKNKNIINKADNWSFSWRSVWCIKSWNTKWQYYWWWWCFKKKNLSTIKTAYKIKNTHWKPNPNHTPDKMPSCWSSSNIKLVKHIHTNIHLNLSASTLTFTTPFILFFSSPSFSLPLLSMSLSPGRLIVMTWGSVYFPPIQ